MKKAKINLSKLSLKKSVVAKFNSGMITGGTGTSWNGCPTIPGEPCDLTIVGCGQTVGCPPATQNCPSNGCPPATQACPTVFCDRPSDSVCPPGVQCY